MASLGIVLALGVGACGGGSGTTGGGTETSAAATTTDTIASPEDTGSTDESGTTAKTGAPTEAPSGDPSAPSCSSQLDPFLGQLDHLRKSLVIGVSYEQYVAELETVRRAYAKLPVDQLDFACLSGAAASAEESFDAYLAAANTWGDCVSDSSCETAGLEPRLQREWHAAAKTLRHAQRTSP